MHRSSSWMSDENNMDCHSSKFVGSVTASQPFVAHRHRPADFREYTSRDDRFSLRGVSSSTRGTFTNSRYRRGNGYSTFDSSRRPRHRVSDMDMYRMQDFDNVLHTHSVGGLLRKHSWSGSNISLGSNRSRSSANRDGRPPGCNRQCDDTDPAHMRTNNSHSVGTKLDDYDDSNGNNVTYVAAGTAPVSTFRGSACGASSSTHSTAVPIATYATPTLPQGPAAHTLSTYQAALNIPIEQCDLHHFDQEVSMLGSATDDLSSPSSQLMFNRRVSDLQTYAARLAHPQHSSAYFSPAMENERTLALLNAISAYQQQCLSQRQTGGLGRYVSELDCAEEGGVDLSATLQQQPTNTAQLAGVLGALYPGVVGRGAGAGGTTAAAARAAAPMDDVSQQRGRAADLGVSEDILPILMQLMQQIGPINGGGTPATAPTTTMDEALRQEKMRQHLQHTAAAQTTGGWSVQPALMQQLMTQLNQMQIAQQQQQQPPSHPPSAAVAAPVIVKKTSTAGAAGQALHTSPSKSTTSSDVTQRSPSEFYSAVVARRSPTYGEAVGGSSKSSTAASSTLTRHPGVSMKLERKTRTTAPPTAGESLLLNAATAVSSVSSVRNDVKTPCEESGYQSESSPPLTTKSQQSVLVSNSSSTVVACGSKATGKSLNSVSNSNNLTSGTQSFAAAAASGLSSSCVQPSVASATAAATPAAAVTATVEAPIAVHTCPTPPASQLGRGIQFEISEMDVLSEEIWHYHNSVTQSEKMLNRKLHLRDMLYYSICPVFPMCGLYVVGSSLNGFGNNTSDMDLCLMITNKDLDQKTDAVVVLNMILSTLQHTEWVSHQKLILAKVPILRIKFAPPFSDITVDLNANNSVAIKNTHLLCYYSSFDWRVRPLVSVVKEWAKRKGINDANRSSFTSYSLVLMVIHYLQCGTEPGVLPSLQQMFPRRFANKCDVRTLNVTLPLETPAASEWQYADKSTLGELLIGFLDYYANKFDYDRDAISVRLGKRIDRAVIARQRPNGGYQQNGTNWRSQWRCICIEEPFTYSNTAHSIYDEMVFDAIKTAFREAHQELDSTRDLQRLLNCKPIAVNAPMGGAMVYVSSYSSTREMSAGSVAGDSPTSGHSRRSTPRGSSSGSSISTAHSAASSSGSSSASDYGEDQDHDRLADVADLGTVPVQRQTKPRSRRISRPNGSISSCLPPSTSPSKIPVTTAAEQ